MSFLLKDKVAVVLGVADRESIAWSIAKTLSQAGAQVTLGYQQKFYSRVRILLEEQPEIKAERCDVLNPDELETFFAKFQSSKLDILVHAIAFGHESVFTSAPSQVTSMDFGETLEVSTHSLAKVVRFAKPHLNPWSSVMTLTFQASQRAMPVYGMMGVAKAALESLVRYLSLELGKNRVRVNAISAGPVKTLAALSEIVAFIRNPKALEQLGDSTLTQIIRDLTLEGQEPEEVRDELELAHLCWDRLQKEVASRSPIPEILTAEDVAQTALFLASEASRKITGQVLHVDAGLSSCQLI